MICSSLPVGQKLSQKSCGELRAHLGFPIEQSLAATVADARRHPGFTRVGNLTRIAPQSALHAKPPENQFKFAKNPLAEDARCRPGHVVPRHVLNIATAVADEVMMPHAFRIELRGA